MGSTLLTRHFFPYTYVYRYVALFVSTVNLQHHKFKILVLALGELGQSCSTVLRSINVMIKIKEYVYE